MTYELFGTGRLYDMKSQPVIGIVSRHLARGHALIALPPGQSESCIEHSETVMPIDTIFGPSYVSMCSNNF